MSDERTTEVAPQIIGRTEADRQLQRFAEYSSSAIIIADLASGSIDHFSPAATRIWSPRDCVGSVDDWELSIHPEDRSEIVRLRAFAVHTGRCQRLQYRITDPEGNTTRRVREICFRMPTDGHRSATLGAIVEDISPEIPVYLVQPTGAPDPILSAALQRMATRMTTFSSQEQLLQLADVLSPGCIVLDLRAAESPPDVVLSLLRMRPAELQVVLIGREETSPLQIIAALRSGAIDYLVEPLNEASLSSSIQRSCSFLMDVHTSPEEGRPERDDRLSHLSRREREVFFGLIEGGTNKSIARTLQISPRTVETHRARLMQRMNVRNLTELLHLAHEARLIVGEMQGFDRALGRSSAPTNANRNTSARPAASTVSALKQGDPLHADAGASGELARSVAGVRRALG